MTSTNIRSIRAAIVLALFSASAYAGAPAPKPDPAVGLGVGLGVGISESTSVAGAQAGAISGSVSGAAATSGDSNSRAQAKTGDSQAIGGDVSVEYSSQYAAQVPTMIQGSLIVPGCGAGVNAGHADTRNASFFGIAWTTDKCYTMMLGSAWASIGEYALACEMWADVGRKALKRRGIKNLNCDEIAARLYQQQIEIERTRNPQNPVTPAYVTEVVDRAFKRAVQK